MKLLNYPVRAHVRLLVMLCVFVALPSLLFAQVKVTGTVTNTQGQPVEGASVVIKNTNAGTVTNASGNYTLTASLKNGKYIVSVTGINFKSFEKEIAVTSSNQNIAVEASLEADINGFDEVVVTGTSAGTTRRQLGSYVSTVKSDQLIKGATGNVLAALQGKTAGAQITQNSGDPAGGMSVRLRGISSISSSSEPLYIVDGVIVNNATNRVTNTSGNFDGGNFVGTVGQNRLVDINPADIDRIEVLNGAAAAAIYGSRANAGVVQIFTKRGTTGAARVSFSTNVTVGELRKRLEFNQAPTKFGGPTDGVGAQTQDILTPSLTNTTPVTRYDYQDAIFRTAIGNDNNISIAGGTEKTKYFLSGSYFFNQGIIKNTDFQRYNFRANVDQVLADWATVSIGLNYVNSAANEKPDGNSFFSPMNSVTIIGNIHDIFKRDALGNLQAVGERGRVNPLSVIEDFKQKQTTSRTLSNISLKLKPIKNVLVDYTLGIDNFSQLGTTYLPPYAYNVSDGFFGGGPNLDPSRNGYASAANNTFFAINHDVNVTYNTAITSNLSSTTQAGFSQQYEKNNYVLLQGRGLAPFVQTVNGASTIIPGNDDRSEISITGFYLQQNFKFRNQLFVTGAARVDGSSVFGQDQRNQTYLKASLSYVLSGTDYWEKLGVAKWFNQFKVRMAYGESGNLTGIGAYDRLNNYTASSFLGRTALNSSQRLANQNVKPERQAEIEFGADMGFFNNRATLSINVYNKKVTDLLINRQIAPTRGFSTLLDNFGELENKGFEIVLGGSPIATKTFNWNINLLYNHNRNKAVRIGQALTLFNTNGGAPVGIIEGQPIGIFYGTFFATTNGQQVKNSAGILQIERGTQINPLQFTTARDANGLPPVTASVLRRIIGNPNPDYTATLVNEFTFKKLSLRVQLDAVQGVDVFNADFRTRQNVGNGLVAEQEHRGLLPRGYVLGNLNIEEWRIDDGSFVKLRELSFSYDLGKVAKISNLSVSFSGRNLISWDNYTGYDPETNAGGQSTLLRGIDFGAVPIPRTYSLGIRANF